MIGRFWLPLAMDELRAYFDWWAVDNLPPEHKEAIWERMDDQQKQVMRGSVQFTRWRLARQADALLDEINRKRLGGLAICLFFLHLCFVSQITLLKKVFLLTLP